MSVYSLNASCDGGLITPQAALPYFGNALPPLQVLPASASLADLLGPGWGLAGCSSVKTEI